jgi:hypothetical protein
MIHRPTLLGELRSRDQPGFDAWLLRVRASAPAPSAASPAPDTLAAPPLPATLLRPPRLVGRDVERNAIDRAWSEGRAVLLRGEAGLGKSRLLAELAQRQGC